MAKAKAEAKEMREMTPADYVRKGFLKTEALETMLHEMAPRGMVEEARKGTMGTMGELDKHINQLKESLGKGLAPAIDNLVTKINQNLPAIEKDLTEFGAALGNVITFMSGTFGSGKKPQEKRFLDYEKEWEDKLAGNIWGTLTGTAGTAGAGGAPANSLVEEQKATNELLKTLSDTLLNAFST
jgi:hypothetical protein